MRRRIQKKSLPVPITLTIEKFSHDGRGIGFHQGRVVMVENAMPGEQVTLKVTHAKTKLWQGESISWVVQSDERVTPKCAHYLTCGGCQQQHIPHDVQITLKQAAIDNQFSRHKLTIQNWALPIISKPYAYRHRARFHVGKKGEIGFRQRQGHQVVNIQDCPVLEPELARCFNIVVSEAPLDGIREFELMVADDGAFGLSASEGPKKATDDLMVWANSKEFITDAPLNYRSGEHPVFAYPGQFTQVNRDINRQMLEQVRVWLQLTQHDRLLDLFCGNGNISMALADDVSAILGLEGNESAIDLATQASRSKHNVNFACANLFLQMPFERADVKKLDPTVVVIDPPRAGADAVCQALAKTKVNKILYVSCDPATLARDLSYFNSTHWHLRKAGLVDMFPNTRHIETMVLLERKLT